MICSNCGIEGDSMGFSKEEQLLCWDCYAKIRLPELMVERQNTINRQGLLIIGLIIALIIAIVA